MSIDFSKVTKESLESFLSKLKRFDKKYIMSDSNSHYFRQKKIHAEILAIIDINSKFKDLFIVWDKNNGEIPEEFLTKIIS